MSNLGLIWYPHKELRIKTKPVEKEQLFSKEFAQNISAMFSMMYYRGGVGLAAPQVGWDARVFIANPDGRSKHDSEAKVFINPSIAGYGDIVSLKEGCLSFPGIYVDIERSSKVSVRYETIDSEQIIEEEYSDFWAQIIQHEYDHLDGILLIDRLNESSLEKIQPILDSHKERIKRIRKFREKRQREAEARKKKKAKRRKKQRNNKGKGN